MGKRSNEEQRAHLLNKIRKLEKKVRKLPDESETEPDQETEAENPDILEYFENVVDQNDTTSNQEEKIDESILEILGVAPAPQSKGTEIHKEIADRWQETLKKGLKKEEKENLFKTYPPFENVPLMVAPKLNPEVGAALNEPAKKRDNLIETRQKQLCTVLSCLGLSLQLCIKDFEENKIDIIKKIHDASQLLCDSFFLDTKGRRTLILAIINKNLKDYLLESEPKTFLFGENLTEKIKTAKAVQKSGQDLRITENIKKNPSQQNNVNSNKNTNHSLNWRGPPRPTPRAQRTGPRAASGAPTYSRAQPKNKKEEKTPRHYRK